MRYLTLAAAALCCASVSAQSALDAMTASKTQLRGTARYLSMGGAFGALGGDLSTLNQNPAGIGVYRSSEVGATLDIDFQRYTMMNTGSDPYTHTQTRAACNNFGYVGSIYTGSSLMPYFTWGASYNRINSFERYYRGYFPQLTSSWTNWAASVSDGYSASDLEGTDSYDPYFGSKLGWTSILAYNCLLINPNPNGASNSYVGLWGNGTYGDSQVEVREKGYVDEYSINFGGNFQNTVYWGLAFGITDLSWSRQTYYDEQLKNAYIPLDASSSTELVQGKATVPINNYQSVSGTGFNMKFGVIIKPINEFRIGLAVHTPTWYHTTYQTNAWCDYRLQGNGFSYDYDTPKFNSYSETGTSTWDMNYRAPWRLMASAAGVIGGRFIISADYVYEAYKDMNYSDDWGSLDDIKSDIKQYYNNTSELRLGAEFRVTPNWSVRAGYDFKSAPSTQEARLADEYIYTTGTQSMCEFDNKKQDVTCGIGYRTGGFYVDAAFVHSEQKSDWYAYTTFPASAGYELSADQDRAPHATINNVHNRLVLSLGFKF